MRLDFEVFINTLVTVLVNKGARQFWIMTASTKDRGLRVLSPAVCMVERIVAVRIGQGLVIRL